MPDFTPVSQYIADNRDALTGMLEKMVCIQSGTANKKGVDAVADMIEQEMTATGFSCELIRQENAGNHLVARLGGTDPDQKQILLIGHMDTVFPEDTAFNYFKQDAEHSYGPGTADMKGGLVVAIFAVKALLGTYGKPSFPITFIFNSDEETGSPTSRDLIRQEAKNSQAAFVFEAGGLNNEVVTGRKGNFGCRLDIEGEAGHAAFAGINKASAILALARKTIEIEALNNPEKGISSNVGLVSGGIGRNTIAQHARAMIDFRFLTAQDYREITDAVTAIAEDVHTPGTDSALTIISQRPPMPQTGGNRKLFERMRAVADTLGMTIIDELRQGVSDANMVADEGIPVLDGLGPLGAKDHSEDEYIITQSLFDRAVLFGSFLSDLGQG